MNHFQDFSHDGQVRDVFFSIDGDIIPYITRSNLEPQLRVKRFSPSEDVILLLPPDKSSIFNIDKLLVKCRYWPFKFYFIFYFSHYIKDMFTNNASFTKLHFSLLDRQFIQLIYFQSLQNFFWIDQVPNIYSIN